MTVQRLSEMYSETVEKTLNLHAVGDEIAWEFGLVPSEAGFIFGMVIQIPSPLLGHAPITASITMGKGMNTTQEELAVQVADAVEGLRSARSSVLAQTNGDGHPGLG